MFFTITFGNEGTNGNWMLGIGNNPVSTLFTNSSNLNAGSYTNGIFAALRFDLGNSNISFKYRKKDASNAISFVEIDQTTFVRANENFVEFYANNSSSSKSYTRRGQPYTVATGCYHLWVNNVRISLPVVDYNIPSTELAINEPVNAFFISSTGNTLPSNNSATLTVADMQARYETDGMFSTRLPAYANVKQNLLDDLQVYPNPATTIVNLQYYSPSPKLIPIKLINTAGVVCLEKVVEVKAGINLVTLDLKKVSPGLYILVVDEKSTRLIIQ